MYRILYGANNPISVTIAQGKKRSRAACAPVVKYKEWLNAELDLIKQKSGGVPASANPLHQQVNQLTWPLNTWCNFTVRDVCFFLVSQLCIVSHKSEHFGLFLNDLSTWDWYFNLRLFNKFHFRVPNSSSPRAMTKLSGQVVVLLAETNKYS